MVAVGGSLIGQRQRLPERSCVMEILWLASFREEEACPQLFKINTKLVILSASTRMTAEGSKDYSLKHQPEGEL